MSKYYDIVNNAKPLDIVFTHKRESLLNMIIWAFLSSESKARSKKIRKTSHVLIYLGDGEVAEVAEWGRVRHKVKRYKRKDYIVTLGRIDKSLYNYSVVYWHAKHSRKKIWYDYIRLFLLGLQRLFGFKMVGDFTKSAMICSEWICSLFMNGGLRLSKKDCCDVTPLDLQMTKPVIIHKI